MINVPAIPNSPDELDYSLLDLAPRLPQPFTSLAVLNLGAGNGEGIFSQQIQEFPFHHLVNVEIHPDALFQLSHHPFASPSIEFINADALEYVRTLPDKSFDVALLIDVLEHFTRDDAFELLRQLKRVCRQKIILFLPFGETPQDEYGGNPHQRHQSTWSPEDFDLPDTNVDICWRHYHIIGTPLAGFVSFDL